MAIKKKELDDIRRLSEDEILETQVEFLTSGSTTMNLAMSGKAKEGGWGRGRIGNLVGDGSSGKTALALEAMFLAWLRGAKIKSKIFPPVKKVRARYNNVENVMDFPLKQMYGQKFIDEVEWVSTPTVEGFGADFTTQCMELAEGEMLFYVLDSWDAMSSDEGMERFIKASEGRGKKEEEGSYNMDVAAYASKKFFKNITKLMKGKDVTLIIISQVRDNIGVMFGKRHKRGGGKALDFYTHQVVWLAVKDKITHTVRGRKMVAGVITRAKVERNKVYKPFREAEATILFDYGIDDISSMVDFLYGPEAKSYEFDGMKFTEKKAFIKYLEDENLAGILQDECEDEWLQIENAIAPDRKPKYED